MCVAARHAVSSVLLDGSLPTGDRQARYLSRVTGIIDRYYYCVTKSGMSSGHAVLLPTLMEVSLLCILESGTDGTYLLGRVPTHPRRALGATACGNIIGEFSLWRYHGLTC